MKIVAWVTMIALAAVLASASICSPYYLSDEGNTFFAGFVTHEMLSFLGVIVTITLASAASLHLELNKLEEKTKSAFPEARHAVKISAYSLLILFTVAFLLVMIKPVFAANQHGQAVINSASILIVLFNLGVLADLTMAVFRIPALRGEN